MHSTLLFIIPYLKGQTCLHPKLEFYLEHTSTMYKRGILRFDYHILSDIELSLSSYANMADLWLFSDLIRNWNVIGLNS